MKNILRKIVVFILQIQARIYLKRKEPKIIVVCGQINRTNVKVAIVQSLGNFKVRDNLKGYNSQIGIPLSILNLKAGFSSFFKWVGLIIKGWQRCLFSQELIDFMVLELAAEDIREIKQVIKFILPDILVVSNIGSDDNLEIYQYLISQLNEQALVLINREELARLSLAGLKARLITFGANQAADLQALEIKQLDNHQEFIYLCQNQSKRQVRLNKFGVHAIYAYIISQFIFFYLNKNGIQTKV
jgi:UDP-N-acetylmuramyl pentapeptide synthase